MDTEKSRHSNWRHQVWLQGARFRLSGSHGGTGRGYNGVLGSPPTKGYPTEGVTTVIPRRESPKITEGGEERGGGDTVSVCQADRLGSRGQKIGRAHV